MAKKIESFGVMLDFSRNAVMTLPALKSFLTTIRKMGYNTLFLYMDLMFYLTYLNCIYSGRPLNFDSHLRQLEENYNRTLAID